jgi:hypothetical protein
VLTACDRICGAVASSAINEGSAVTETSAVGRGVSRPVVLAQLERVLDSPQFRTTKKCSLFLRYVIEHAVDNHLECLKERVLGVEVFKRDPQYDTNQDPVVRGTAGEVRKRLAQYYLEPGRAEELRISMPAGSYVPEIHLPSQKVERTISRRRIQVLWILAVACTIAIAAVFLAPGFRRSALDRFWAPLMEQQGNVLVCIGQPKSYTFNGRVKSDIDRWFESAEQKQNPPTNIASVPLSDIVPAWDWNVSLDDAQAFSQLSNLFAQKGKKVELRGGRSVSLADLRGRPVVLIGAFNNEWSLGLTGELRFYFDDDHHNQRLVVRDRQKPDNVVWSVSNTWPHGTITVDYAIVSRVFDPTTEQTVVIAAGITQFGTNVAAEFLTNEAYFAEALKNAPDNWQRKNMQVVLSTKVMSGNHGPPNVLAVHFW